MALIPSQLRERSQKVKVTIASSLSGKTLSRLALVKIAGLRPQSQLINPGTEVGRVTGSVAVLTATKSTESDTHEEQRRGAAESA